MPLKTLFGPVPSRRLGRSLGIDVIPPKTCTYDCVYCESGRTTHLSAARREFVAEAQVLADLRAFFIRYPDGADALTFSSAGEPTLHLGLGRLIERIKKDHPSRPLIVLTNGSLLWDPEVRRDLMQADCVAPSLDAATPDVFRGVDRPHPSLDLGEIIEGLYAFRRDYPGRLHVEILLVRGMNDHPQELGSLRRIIDRVRPDCVELNTVVRPPACAGVRGLTRDEMTKAAAYFPPQACRIIGSFAVGDCSTKETEGLEDRVLQLVARRPCSLEEMAASLGASLEALRMALGSLESEKRIKRLRHGDRVFHCPADPP